eukprot:s1609_g11.t1
MWKVMPLWLLLTQSGRVFTGSSLPLKTQNSSASRSEVHFDASFVGICGSKTDVFGCCCFGQRCCCASIFWRWRCQ